MRIPLLKPLMPKLEEVQKYYHVAEQHGQFSNFGLIYDIAIQKLQKVYPTSWPVLVNNGTTAIQVALQSTLPRGSRIALPQFTFAATYTAVLAAGMVPVLIGTHVKSWQLDLQALRDNRDKFDHFIMVSPFGYGVDIQAYDQLAEELNCKIVYDFAAAWLHEISTKHPTTFSFHATKQLPIGEGGAVMFANRHTQGIGKRLINFDFVDQIPQSEYGFNGKLDELHCAVLCTQLDRDLSSLNYSNYVLETLTQVEYGTIKAPIGFNKINPQLPVIDTYKEEQLREYLLTNNVAFRKYYNPGLELAFGQDALFSKTSYDCNLNPKLGLPRPNSREEAHIIIDHVLNGIRK